MGDQRESKSPNYWDAMAKPKQKHPKFVSKEDRRSLYWVDEEPRHTSQASDRILILSQPKCYPVKARSTEWAVSESAKQYSPSDRLLSLTGHKEDYKGYKHFRPVPTPVSDTARRGATPTSCEVLSRPKSEQRGKIMIDWNLPLPRPVSAAAMSTNASEKIVQLSEPKSTPRDFRGERPIQWPVSRASQKYAATSRIQTLCRVARPGSRTREPFEFWRVAPGALRSRCTPRMLELCVPLARKKRAKYVPVSVI